MQSAKFHYDIVYWREPYDLGHITVYQIGDLCCNADYEVPLHQQACYEISYIASGKGLFIVDGKETVVSENQIYLNRPGQTHKIVSSRDDPLRYVYLGFWFKESHPDFSLFRPIRDFFDNTTEFIATDTRSIYKFFFEAFSEIISSGDMMHEMLKAYVSQIIITAYRCLSHGVHTKYVAEHKGYSEEQIVYNIMNYIESNSCNINQLSDIGAELGYSYPYLSQLFSNKMGYSIQSYFRRRLFERAIDMMKEDKKISEIASSLGYSTVYSFSRAFTNCFGESPSHYRIHLKEEEARTRPG